MTRFKMLGRLSALCGALAIVVLTAGCPLLQPNPCNGFDADDNNKCTTDTCEVVDGAATAVHTPVDCGDKICNPADGECVDCLTDADCDQGLCSEGAGHVCVECLLDANCDDNNECTTDTCTNATCEHT